MRSRYGSPPSAADRSSGSRVRQASGGQRSGEDGDYVEYQVDGGKGGAVKLTIEALPTHPLTPEHETIVAVSIGEGDPALVRFVKGIDDEKDPIWQDNVLRGLMRGTIEVRVPAGPYTLKLWAADPAAVILRLAFEPMADPGS